MLSIFSPARISSGNALRATGKTQFFPLILHEWFLFVCFVSVFLMYHACRRPVQFGRNLGYFTKFCRKLQKSRKHFGIILVSILIRGLVGRAYYTFPKFITSKL